MISRIIPILFICILAVSFVSADELDDWLNEFMDEPVASEQNKPAVRIENQKNIPVGKASKISTEEFFAPENRNTVYMLGGGVLFLVFAAIIVTVLIKKHKPHVENGENKSDTQQSNNIQSSGNRDFVLRNYVYNNLRKGYSPQSVNQALKNYGCTPEEINKAFGRNS